MILELNPVKWFGAKSPRESNHIPHPILAAAMARTAARVSIQGTAAQSAESSEETTMSTAPVTPVAESGWKRFIDDIGGFFRKVAPVIEGVAVAAEPFLALTPFGPEYDLVVNAVIGVQQTATASLTTGATLSAEQKMALVLEAVTPGITAILKSKGIVSNVPTAISQFAQNVYNLQTGPSTTVAPTPAKAA